VKRGFTLLEVLVATAIMAIAVAGVLGNLRTSLSNAARLTGHERAAALARWQMDDLLARQTLPFSVPIEGVFPAQWTGGSTAGWRARVTPFESVALPPAPPPPGTRMMERIELEVWWTDNGRRRTLNLEGYRSSVVTPTAIAAFEQMQFGTGERP
jgi:general secretion pathway protein I